MDLKGLRKRGGKERRRATVRPVTSGLHYVKRRGPSHYRVQWRCISDPGRLEIDVSRCANPCI
jgi:hypothetical protein